VIKNPGESRGESGYRDKFDTQRIESTLSPEEFSSEGAEHDPQEVRKTAEWIAHGMGAVVFGIADLGEVADESGDVCLSGLTTGICFGYRLSDVVLEGIVEHPTRTYQYHYRQVNTLLDQIGLRITTYIQNLGYRAFPVPSSQIVDWEKLTGHVSHRAVGRRAGLGWIGRNNLLVNPRHGSRVRYATVLTDLSLPADKPLDDGCGSCRSCVKACPGGAIGEIAAEFDLEKCKATIDEIRKPENIGSRICGVCVKACRGRPL
jgi:epoxyqueuosine reductase QueG